MSKRQRKRLEQIQQRKEKEARRADLYKVLEQQRLTAEQQALLRSTKAFAQGVRGQWFPFVLGSPWWGDVSSLPLA